MNVAELTKKLVNIPSVTGNEARVTEFLATYLSSSGYDVRLQEVLAARQNILATLDEPAEVILCTHLDTVPPFFPASEDNGRIHGRGSCDAKGIAATMIFAGEMLRADGIRNFGFLFLVGEETDSAGARKANELDVGSRFVIVGEPTENRLAVGHKGLILVRLRAGGQAAHSALPHLGDSAIEKLLNTLNEIRGLQWQADPVLGEPLINIGKIEGGAAANVIPDSAEASLAIRNTLSSEYVLQQIETTLKHGVTLEVLSRSEPQKLHTVAGFEHVVIPFGTDIPHLHNFGKALLIGPGSIEVAHTEAEHILKDDLQAGMHSYVKLVTRLLEES